MHGQPARHLILEAGEDSFREELAGVIADAELELAAVTSESAVADVDSTDVIFEASNSGDNGVREKGNELLV